MRSTVAIITKNMADWQKQREIKFAALPRNQTKYGPSRNPGLRAKQPQLIERVWKTLCNTQDPIPQAVQPYKPARSTKAVLCADDRD